MAKKAKKKSSKTIKKVTRKKPKTKTAEIIPSISVVKQAVRVSGVRKSCYNTKKLNLVLGNLTFFVILFVVSAILYSISKTEFYLSLFFMLSLIMGVLSIALLMVLLVCVFSKFINN